MNHIIVLLVFTLFTSPMLLADCGPTPPPPTNLQLTVIDSYQIRVQVDPIIGSQIRFIAFREQMPSGSFQKLINGYPQGHFIDSNKLIPGTQICYKIQAQDACNQVSVFTEEAEATLPAGPLPNMDLPPVPTELTATASNGVVHVTWTTPYLLTEPDGVTQVFYAQKSTSPTGPWSKIVDQRRQNFDDSSVVLGTTYYYRVRGYNPFSWGDGEFCAPVSVTP